jgi:hypothetical protein
MHFDVIFDVTQEGVGNLWWLLAGLPLILVAVVLTRLRRQLKSTIPALIAWVAAVPSFLWILVTGVSLITSAAGLSNALRSGKCEVTEGLITELDPMPYGGHKYERFTVAGKEFYYSDFIKTPGFHHSVSHGGPLRTGQYVRIHYVGNDIARLEIAR